MTRRSSKYLEWMLRLAIGGVFIYAGWAKRNEGIEFADSVASFRILPSVVIVPFMLSIVPFEIGAGAMVLTGWQKRVGALGLLLMASLYSIALALALARGITVNCGCFGTSAVGANPWVDLGRDLLLAAGCAVLYRIATRSVAPKPAL
jgi:putative oxidoreductase